MNIEKTIQAAVQYYHSGDLEKAEQLCKKIINYQSDNADFLYFFGIVSIQLGRVDSAIHSFRRSLQHTPMNADVHFALGMALNQKGLTDEALGFLEKTVELNPGNVQAFYQLAAIYQARKEVDQAIDCYQKARALDPHNAQALYNLGQLLSIKGQFHEAVACFHKVLDLDPVMIDAYNGLGNALQELKDFEEAIKNYQEAIRIKPSDPTAYINIGICMHNTGKLEDAITHFKKALSLNPNLEVAYNHIGFSLVQQDRLTEAIECFNSSLRLNPRSLMAYIKLGYIFGAQGKLREAQSSYRRAIEIQPDDSAAHQGLLLLIHYGLEYDAAEIFGEHVRFAKWFEEPLRPGIYPHTNEKMPDRRMRIGYVSPDFRRHSVSYFIEPVLAAHDKKQCEVYCYSSCLDPDDLTERIKDSADCFRDITMMSDNDISELIRKDQIDILIDLAGHTANNRLLVFARKPAPVQVSWIGYPNTTGLSSMDYKIVDRFTDPPGLTEQFYTEELIRMPESFLCFLPDGECPAVGTLPALSTGHITFGSFNNFSKVTPEVIKLWADILKGIPDSRLIMKTKSLADSATRAYATEMFTHEGIAAERMELLSFVPSSRAHLDLYNRIDIALDSFPYNGTTTTCEALWMGVPVITLAGDAHASRVGLSLLSNVGLPELIASSHGEYVEKAAALTRDLNRLNTLRQGLRDMMSRSPLTDAKRFTVNLENCYHIIWRKWCSSHSDR